MSTYSKKCKLSNNWVQFEIIDSVADMKLFEVDYPNFKLFCKLLNEAINELSSDYDVKYIRQMVLYEEYKEFLKSKTTWNIIEKEDATGTVIIECKIEEFIDNFAQGNDIK